MKLTTLTLGSIIAFSFLIGLTASQVYDPWYDLDSDGDIDIFDIVPAANAYGTTGNSTRNVYITNFPPAVSETRVVFNGTLGIVPSNQSHFIHLTTVNTTGYKSVTLYAKTECSFQEPVGAYHIHLFWNFHDIITIADSFNLAIGGASSNPNYGTGTRALGVHTTKLEIYLLIYGFNPPIDIERLIIIALLTTL